MARRAQALPSDRLHRARCSATAAVALSAVVLIIGCRAPAPHVDENPTATISASEAVAIMAVHRGGPPAAFAGLADVERAERWPVWAAARDRAIRARVSEGDEDAVLHLWLFGTSFTSAPRATTRMMLSLDREGRAALLERRRDDLVAGMQAPGDNERLLFARRVFERAGVDVQTPAGALEAASRLRAMHERMTHQLARFRLNTTAARQAGDETAALSAYTSYYRDRGLSSDTSVLAAYAVDRAIDTLVTTGQVRPGVRRVAIVGPGLDFVDKAEGHDFYPLQTLQPFALVDSLARTGLADPAGVEVTALDINPQVLEHLQRASARAATGADYVVHLPLSPDDARHEWDPGVVAYWQRFGRTVGTDVPPRPLPPGMEDVRLRAVRVRPEVIRSVRSVDANVVLERLTPAAMPEPFDLVVETNVLVYYEPFDQALALANVAAMLKPGGLFLTNAPRLPLPSSDLSAPVVVDVAFDRQGGGDTIYAVTRRPAAR